MNFESGDQQAKPIASLSKVRALGSPPSTGITQTLVVPLFLELKTICLASGDRRGNEMSWSSEKSFLSRPLFRFTVQISSFSARLERYNNWSPSGYQLGR